MAQLYEATATQPLTLTARFEDFDSNFEATARKLFSFAGVMGGGTFRDQMRFEQFIEAALRHDLSRRGPNGGRKVMHVSNTSQKDVLRSLLLAPASGIAAELRRFRQRLGYAVVSTEPNDGSTAPTGPLTKDDPAALQRWMLAILARDQNATLSNA